MSQRLIDADNLKARLKNGYKRRESALRVLEISTETKEMIDSLIDVIDEEPTVDPVRHGHWIYRTDGIFYGMYKCSACRDTVPKPSRYCPMCGAKMDEAEAAVERPAKNGASFNYKRECITELINGVPSAQPDAIPLEWIAKHLEWLDNCDNDFAQLAKVSIKAMVELWKKDRI